MAAGATVYKADLNVADLDRHYYADFPLTVARHPSETEERLMMRLLAFGLNAHERLEFGRGIDASDEPDLWVRDLTGQIELWIDVGQPDERDVRRAAGRAARVLVHAYGRTLDTWWDRTGAALGRSRNVSVVAFPATTSEALAALAARTMQLQLTLQDGDAWLACGTERVAIERRWLLGAP